MPRNRSILERAARPRRHGFTLVELLVVIVVITILIASVVAVSTTFINKAKAQNTRAVLVIVRDAVEAFQREQTAHPTIVTATQNAGAGEVGYAARYGYFPPDELEMFTDDGLPGSDPGVGSLAVGGAVMVPPPPYEAMYFYDAGPSSNPGEHRDLAAMIVAIELYSESASALLAGISDRYWADGSVDAATGLPDQFLDRDPPGWDPDDLQIRYIVDDWGMPISYLAQRDYDPNALSGTPPTDSSNLPDVWNQASTEMIRVNGGQPIIMSYGPDGKNQLTFEAMVDDDAAASLVVDWMDGDPTQPKIDHHLNADNVYTDPSLKERLAEGIQR